MHATDVIAYACDGALRCPECAVKAGWTDGGLGEGDREGVSPVFADSETDSPSHCEACGEHIPEMLTSEGARYATARMRAYLRTHGDEGDWDTLYAWACELSCYGGAVGRIARRFRARGEFYRGTHEMRRRYSYSGGGYAFRFDRAAADSDPWETVIAPEGPYRPLRCEVIDGAPCVVFERKGTGETYAVTEASAHRPAGDAAGA